MDSDDLYAPERIWRLLMELYMEKNTGLNAHLYDRLEALCAEHVRFAPARKLKDGYEITIIGLCRKKRKSLVINTEGRYAMRLGDGWRDSWYYSNGGSNEYWRTAPKVSTVDFNQQVAEMMERYVWKG